ncbi:deleted in azoospermia-like isoform X2 [Exaiptasia diaphana]|uniref:RRM domain-containing protein n=1 Tax=Exaiptasia diaphana TaxID=2652724 RepID=A0A913X1A6_EXADI|nr:deleted in azoospermia-like isoform X2 [Exaiptasia diaphana]
MAYDNTYLVGKRFPNRLFVGGLPAPVTAPELASFFSNFGSVVDSKVILDEEGVSKGYGFVSFKSAEDVKNVGQMGTLFLRNKKLNIGPAVKKEGPAISPETVIVPSAPSKGEFFYPIQQQQQQTIPSMQYAVQEPQPVMWYYYFPTIEQAQYNNIYQLQNQVAKYQILPEGTVPISSL